MTSSEWDSGYYPTQMTSSEVDSGRYYPPQMERRDWSDSFVYVTIIIIFISIIFINILFFFRSEIQHKFLSSKIVPTLKDVFVELVGWHSQLFG